MSWRKPGVVVIQRHGRAKPAISGGREGSALHALKPVSASNNKASGRGKKACKMAVWRRQQLQQQAG